MFWDIVSCYILPSYSFNVDFSLRSLGCLLWVSFCSQTTRGSETLYHHVIGYKYRSVDGSAACPSTNASTRYSRHHDKMRRRRHDRLCRIQSSSRAVLFEIPMSLGSYARRNLGKFWSDRGRSYNLHYSVSIAKLSLFNKTDQW